MLSPVQVARWADLLVHYGLRLAPGELVSLSAATEARPLIEACYRAIVLGGGHSLLRVEFPGMSEFFLEHATPEQLAFVPTSSLHEARSIDASIRIAAEADTKAMSRLDPNRQAIYNRARNIVRKAALQKRWVLTQYPTQAYADDAKMSLEEYEAFVASSMFLDRDDPSAAWVELGRRQAGLVEYMSGVKTIRIEAEGTDITLSVAGRTWINSDGRRNMPSGEIFTGPVETSAQGKIRCGFPVCRDGRELVGIELEFVDGKVVSAKAEQGEADLLAMLDLDPGARFLGELGIGLNPGIQRFTGSILYDEKIGGTIHLALGQSYAETGGLNTSALHWDLIVDTRRQGRINADGKVVMENGVWSVGSIETSSI